MSGPWDEHLERMRSDPLRTMVRYRINNNEWQTCSGLTFLQELADVPFAGTIDIDCVYVIDTWTAAGSSDDFKIGPSGDS